MLRQKIDDSDGLPQLNDRVVKAIALVKFLGEGCAIANTVFL